MRVKLVCVLDFNNSWALGVIICERGVSIEFVVFTDISHGVREKDGYPFQLSNNSIRANY